MPKPPKNVIKTLSSKSITKLNPYFVYKDSNSKSKKKQKRKEKKTISFNGEIVEVDPVNEESTVEQRHCCFRRGGNDRFRTWYKMKDIETPLVMKYLARYGLLWEMFIYATVVAHFLMSMFGIVFTYHNTHVWNLVFSLDCIFAMDVIMRLLIEFWRFRTQTEVLILPMPYRFIYCILDLISLLPIYSIAILPIFVSDKNDMDVISYLDFYRLNVLIRILPRFWLFYGILEDLRVISEEFLFIVKFFNIYLGFINLVSCVFFVLLSLNPVKFLLWQIQGKHNLDDTWASDYHQIKPGYGIRPLELFLLTTHFSTATVTTVGYGDLYARNEAEMICCIFIMLFGAIFLNGYFTSQITNFQLELDGARFDLFHRLDAIKHFLVQAGMNEFFTSKVEHYYKYLWTYREGVDRVIFIDRLPRSLQEDVYYDVCSEMFHKSILFRKLDEAFLRAVSKIVKIALYNPNMVLCRCGGYANQMYYILQGECQAMSKHDASKMACVLRAGSLIGEINLLFSSPYSSPVETITACQFISIDKEELMMVFNKFPAELVTLRARAQLKIRQLTEGFELFGKDPVCWVVKKPVKSEDPAKLGKGAPKRIGRWGDGFNRIIADDVVGNDERFVIFETPCTDKKFEKNHATPYLTSVVPEILNTKISWIRYWNFIIMAFAAFYSFIGPFCFAFGVSSQLEQYICTIGDYFEYVNMVMFFLDVFVEILGACPVEGIYYKFRDGIKIKSRKFFFYLDIVAAMPFELFYEDNDQNPLAIFNISLKSTKIWKVIRYLKFLDNINPKDLFWYRLAQTFMVLMYGIHFIACFMFNMACPIQATHIDTDQDGDYDDVAKCKEEASWISSYKIRREYAGEEVPLAEEPDELAKNAPYLLSFYFSAATLTSAGFGDFSPQRYVEIICTIIFQLIGFFIIGYYTALLTSALACVVKPRLEFQQKLVSVRRFMEYYVMPEFLQRRIIEHYELQFQYRQGVNLPIGVEHFLYDAPDYLKHDVLYTEIVLLLDGVPLFSKTEAKNIIKMAEMLSRYLIPPNVKFLFKGEVRRTLYIIRKGSIGLYDEVSKDPEYIMESSGHFGLRDLLFGEPSRYDYKTLSYCEIYEIKHKVFMEVFDEDEDLMTYLDDVRESVMSTTDDSSKTQPHNFREAKTKDRSIDVPNWIWYKPSVKDPAEQEKYLEYSRYFGYFAGGRIMKFFLQNGVIHPAGKFSRVWASSMSLVSIVVLCLIMMETFMHFMSPAFRHAQLFFDFFYYIDVYIRLHFAYYLADGLLVAHPLKTAASYIFEGTFFFDVISCTHPEVITWILGYTDVEGYGPGSTWHTKLRWLKLFQIRRVLQIFEIVHGIFTKRTAYLFALYVGVTLIVCTVVASIALFIACPWDTNDWAEGDEYRLPLCNEHTWATSQGIGDMKEAAKVMAEYTSRWVVGVYYVCQVILVIGFGDMITFSTAEIYLLIFMAVFGFIFLRCIIADITAAEVDSDEIRSRYIDGMKCIVTAMQRENVDNKLIVIVQDHLSHTWKKSRGLQPRDLFNDLHTALESDLYLYFAGGALRKIPVFQDFPTNVLRGLRKYVKKIYYLAGDRISRYGNLEYEMNIILNGKVWMVDKSMNYGCTLHKNETFGETSLISRHPRRYTAIAATNVEVFVITQDDFAVVLERYPKIRQIICDRTGNGHFDVFETRIYDMIEWLKKLKGDEKNMQIDILERRSAEIKHVVYSKEPLAEDDEEALEYIGSQRKKWHAYFFGAGNDDDNLPILYFASQRSRSTGKLTYFPPLIHPNCSAIRWFNTFMNFIFFFYPAVTIYEIAFPHISSIEKDYIGQVVHKIANEMGYSVLLFIVIQFLTPYPGDEGTLIKSSWSVFTHYMTSITRFWFDFIAVVPSFIAELNMFEDWKNDYKNTTNRYVYGTLRGLRCLLLFRYYRNHFAKKDDLTISQFRQKIVISVSSFCFMAHLIACVFYYVSSCSLHIPENLQQQRDSNSPCPVGTWTYIYTEKTALNLEPDQQYPWRWWVRSLYWVITVVSTTGFGDITPQKVYEMGIGIVCVFCGAFILSIILSQFTAGMASLTKAEREYLYQVKLLVRYLKNVGLSGLRGNQIQIYFKYVWTNCRGSLYDSSIQILPHTMRTEVANALFESVLKHVKLFEMDDKTFLRQIASKVSHTVYLPGVCIVKEGDPGDTLYIVYKGRVSGVVDTDFSQDLKSVYLVGEVFGKLPAFFHDAWYKKSYRAEEYTEVLALSQTDILHLASVYSNFYKTLTAYIEVNYDPNGSFDCIFSEKSGKAKNIYDLGEEFLSSLQKRQTSSARAYKGDDKKEKEKRLFKKYKDMATHTKKLVEESKERSRLLSQSSLGATQNTKTKKKKKRSRHTNSKSQKSLKSVRSITSQKDVYSRKTAEKIKTEDLLKSAPSRDHVGRPLRKKSAPPLGRGDSGGRSVSATGLGDSRRRQRRRKKTGRLEDENILNPIHELYDRRFEQAEKDGVSKPKTLRTMKKKKKKHHHRRRKQSPHTPAPPDRPRKVQPREESSHPEAGPSPKIKPKRKRPLKLSERPPWHY